MKEFLGFFFGSVLGLIFLAGVIVASAWGSLQLYKWLGPQREEVRREVFENTPSYIRGKEQRLTDLCLEQETMDGAHKSALRNVILLEAEELRGNEHQMSAYLQDCLNRQTGGQ